MAEEWSDEEDDLTVMVTSVDLDVVLTDLEDGLTFQDREMAESFVKPVLALWKLDQ